MTTHSSNKHASQSLDRVLALIAGTQKNLTAKMNLILAGVSTSQPALLAKLSAAAKLFTDVDDARSQVKQKLLAKEATLPAMRVLLEDLDAALKSKFGARSPLLADFGILPPKPKTPQTPAEKVLSAANAKRTRKIHGILGSKQRAALTLAGKPGLVVVSPTGEPMPGLAQEPIAPAGSPTGTSATPGSDPKPGSGSGA